MMIPKKRLKPLRRDPRSLTRGGDPLRSGPVPLARDRDPLRRGPRSSCKRSRSSSK